MQVAKLKTRFVYLQIFVLILVCRNAPAASLNDALALSYQTSPELQSAIQSLKLVDEEMPLAISGILPTASYDVQRGQERTTSGATEENSKDDYRSIGVTQPLFNGGNTYASIKKANNKIMAARENFRIAEQNVLLSAVTAYMDMVRDNDVYKLAENNQEVLKKHLDAVQARFTMGETTQTDVAQAKANLAQSVSELIGAKRNLESSRATYIKIIGQEPQNVVMPDNPITINGSVEELIQIALANNPYIKAADYGWEAAKNDIAIQKSALLPSVSAFINKTTYSTTSSSTSDTIGANISVPLYQSGSEYVKIRQAKIAAGKASLDIAVVRNQVSEEVIKAYHEYEVATSLIESNKSSVESFTLALEGVRQESLAGLRTTIDLLDAQHDVIEAKSKLISSSRDEIVSSYSLLSKLGKLNIAELGLKVDAYNPNKNTNRVKYQMVGF